jgi:two-component system, OmpR family, alkaline phosphatase synthesis response regulator PhoP
MEGTSLKKARILIVDDEEDILELVRFHLTREGYDTVCVESGEKALRLAAKEPFDLLVLDLMLPGLDGLEVTQRLKHESSTQSLPIVMLTAKGEEADIVTGLELGADDYIPKPFSPRVLIARIKAVLRRKGRDRSDKTEEVLQIDALVIHPGRREVMIDGHTLDLTYTEFQVLHFLARRPGWVLTRGQIVDAVRGSDYPVTDRSVDVQIVGLRKKLGACGDYIQTVRGVGYRFKEK